MEVRTFVDSLLLPLMVMTSKCGNKRYITLAEVSIAKTGLWKEISGELFIEGLLGIDIAFGYDIYKPPNNDQLVVSLICKMPPIFLNPDSFFENPDIYFDVSDNIKKQVISFFQLYPMKFEYLNPIDYINNDDFTFRLTHGVTIIPEVTTSGNLSYGVLV